MILNEFFLWCWGHKVIFYHEKTIIITLWRRNWTTTTKCLTVHNLEGPSRPRLFRWSGIPLIVRAAFWEEGRCSQNYLDSFMQDTPKIFYITLNNQGKHDIVHSCLALKRLSFRLCGRCHSTWVWRPEAALHPARSRVSLSNQWASKTASGSLWTTSATAVAVGRRKPTAASVTL